MEEYLTAKGKAACLFLKREYFVGFALRSLRSDSVEGARGYLGESMSNRLFVGKRLRRGLFLPVRIGQNSMAAGSLRAAVNWGMPRAWLSTCMPGFQKQTG